MGADESKESLPDNSSPLDNSKITENGDAKS